MTVIIKINGEDTIFQGRPDEIKDLLDKYNLKPDELNTPNTPNTTPHITPYYPSTSPSPYSPYNPSYPYYPNTAPINPLQPYYLGDYPDEWWKYQFTCQTTAKWTNKDSLVSENINNLQGIQES